MDSAPLSSARVPKSLWPRRLGETAPHPPHQGFADVFVRPGLEPFGVLAPPVPSALVEVAAISPPQGALRGILWDAAHRSRVGRAAGKVHKPPPTPFPLGTQRGLWVEA